MGADFSPPGGTSACQLSSSFLDQSEGGLMGGYLQLGQSYACVPLLGPSESLAAGLLQAARNWSRSPPAGTKEGFPDGLGAPISPECASVMGRVFVVSHRGRPKHPLMSLMGSSMTNCSMTGVVALPVQEWSQLASRMLTWQYAFEAAVAPGTKCGHKSRVDTDIRRS
eukprot:5553077-Pyramimonas_sp.AAC.1